MRPGSLRETTEGLSTSRPLPALPVSFQPHPTPAGQSPSCSQVLCLPLHLQTHPYHVSMSPRQVLTPAGVDPSQTPSSVGTPFQAQSHPSLNPDHASQGSSSKFLQLIQSFSLYSPNLCSPVTAAIPSYYLCDTESSHCALCSNLVNQSLYHANNFSVKFSL